MRDPMVPHFCRIRSRTVENDEVFTFTLESKERPWFLPGQFNMLYAFGVGEVPISISGDPSKNKHWVHTIRVVGKATESLAALKVGDHVGVRGPFGSSWPVKESFGKDLLFIAGGLGLAPLRPAFYFALMHREKFGKITLLYGARSRRDLLYLSELKKWKKSNRIEIEVSLGVGDRKWKGAIGHVTTFIPKITLVPQKTVALLCGPEIMMRFSASELEKRGVQPKQVYVSLERNMKCAIGFCGHCQFGPHFLCKEGPVFPYDQVESLLRVREI